MVYVPLKYGVVLSIKCREIGAYWAPKMSQKIRWIINNSAQVYWPNWLKFGVWVNYTILWGHRMVEWLSRRWWTAPKLEKVKMLELCSGLFHYGFIMALIWYYGSTKASKWLKFTSNQIQDGGQHANCKWLNCYESAAHCQTQLRAATLHRSAEPALLLKPKRLIGRVASSANAAVNCHLFWFF